MHPAFQSVKDEVHAAVERTVTVLTGQVAQEVRAEISVPVGRATGPRGGLLLLRSRPGEPPRTEFGDYLKSWQFEVIPESDGTTGTVYTNDPRGKWFTAGTKNMAIRPHGIEPFNRAVGQGPNVLSSELGNG